MATNDYGLRIVEITVTQQKRRVWMTYRLSQTDGGTNRDRIETVMVKMDMAVPATDTELLRLAGVMANYAIPPDRRHVRPPKALVWRQVAFEPPETHNHGEGVDGRQLPMDPLPLFDGLQDPPPSSTILSGPKGQGKSAPRSGSDPRPEPSVRRLGARGGRGNPGG